MKLGDDEMILKDDGDRKESEKAASSTAGECSSSTPTRLTVGYALTSKKRESFLQPMLLELARCKGILFVAIDENQPLSNQGPFDVILHKLAGKDWCQALEDYGQEHPNVTVIDPPAAIRQVQNRQFMLEKVPDINLSLECGMVSIPRQIVCTGDPSSIADEVTKEGLQFPLVAKPLVVDGSAKSHEMFLAYDKDSVVKLEPPLVLQEFINHGGVLFKVYIIGESIKVVKRLSLPDVIKQDMISFAGVYGFPRVSCSSASADDACLDPRLTELPPRPLLERLSKELRIRLGLRLFNIDMIRQHGTISKYYVIDINYFPGYGKMPEYEHIFTDFLLSLEQRKQEERTHKLTD